MAYPEKTASYKNEPAWLGRMKKAEGGSSTPYRDDGGSVGGPESLDDPDADTSPMAVEEKGRTLPMSQKSSAQNQQAMSPDQSRFLNEMANQAGRADGGRLQGQGTGQMDHGVTDASIDKTIKSNDEGGE